MPPRHILVVDDDPTVVELEKSLLTIAGHQVETAVCTAVAIQLLAENAYDVLITDLNIEARTDGFVLAALFKRDNPGGMAIVNTGTGDISANLHDFQKIIDLVVLKPAAPEVILQAVGRAAAVGPRAGRKRLYDLLHDHRSQISAAWVRDADADSVLRRIPLTDRAGAADVEAVIEVIIGRVADPNPRNEARRRSQVLAALAHRGAGCTPTSITIEFMLLQNAINETIRGNLILVNLGTLWTDILRVNNAVEDCMIELLHYLEGGDAVEEAQARR